jgi:hypothetical protein
MAPVLFLFLMPLQKHLKLNGRMLGLEYAWYNLFYEKKCWLVKASSEDIFQKITFHKGLQWWIYVDDGAIIFASCTDSKKGLTLIHKHFERLGLEMHIG